MANLEISKIKGDEENRKLHRPDQGDDITSKNRFSDRNDDPFQTLFKPTPAQFYSTDQARNIYEGKDAPNYSQPTKDERQVYPSPLKRALFAANKGSGYFAQEG